MNYALLNTEGTVERFPYFSPELERLRLDQDLPTNVVKVDIETNKPSISWDQKAIFDQVVETSGTYAVTYAVVDRYADDTAMLKGITVLKKQHEDINERTFTYKAKELLNAYPDVERETWLQQRQEAAAYQADNSAATPLLSVIATARNITVADLVTKVLAKASEYDTSYGELLGKYQKNREILASIDLADNTTWDNIDNLVRL